MTTDITITNTKDNISIGLVLTGDYWATAAHAAHKHTYDAQIKKGNKSLVLRPYSYFEALVHGLFGGLVVAADPNNTLQGFCALQAKTDMAQAMVDKNITYPDTDGRIQKLCGVSPIGVIESLIVLPNAKGKSLSLDILKGAFTCFKDSICTPKGVGQKAESQYAPMHGQLFAQTNITAECSWMKFLECGFIIEGTWLEQTVDGPKQKLLLRYASDTEREKLIGAQKGTLEKTAGEKPEGFHKRIVEELNAGHRIMLLPQQKAGSKAAHLALVPV